MKKYLLSAFIVAGMTAPLPAETAAPAATPAPAATTNATVLHPDPDKTGYALGWSLASGWKRNGLTTEWANLDAVDRGIKDGLTSTNSELTEEQMKDVFTVLREAVIAKRKQEADDNKAAGEKYLAENKAKPGVIALADGLQYKVLKAGEGESPKAGEIVTVQYRGTLVDGTEFDSSYKRDKPFSFAVGRGVIPGWTEAVQLMKPGATWQLFIPPNLAYGDYGHPPAIAPGSTLIFEVELLSVAPAPAPQTPPHPITSDIIRVPSKEELEHGAKIETIKPDQIPQAQAQEAKAQSAPKPEDKK